MEGKRRNLRRKIDHGEEDDVSQSSSNKNPKYSLSSLSFEVDKEVEETFRVKKSRESKLLKHKKVRQPPSLTPIHESPLMSDFDRTYSEQSLRELRQLQKFASSQIIGEQFQSQSEDVIVMNGDEFEEKIVEENSFLQQSANMIHKHELVQNEDDDSWENELAARGGIKLHVNNPHAANEVPRSRASSISSLKLFLNKNLTISKEQCSRHSRQIDLTEMTLSSLKDEKIVVNENLAQKTSSLLFFQVLIVVYRLNFQ